jgi:hypothetical protein
MSATPEDMQKVSKLLALANDGDDEENRTAAIKAVSLMKQYNLVLVPKERIEEVRKMVGDAQALAKKYEGEKKQGMMLGALAGFMMGKGKLLG